MDPPTTQQDHLAMGLFRRKHSDDDAVEEHCPQCNEPLPEGAVECLMCGADLRPAHREDVETAPTRDAEAGPDLTA